MGGGETCSRGLSMADRDGETTQVTSPSPENLKTLFEFIFKGFDALVSPKKKQHKTQRAN